MPKNNRKILQSLFKDANRYKSSETVGLFKAVKQNTISAYIACNNILHYFLSDDFESQKEFSKYFHFFEEVSKTEDSQATESELANRAYIATVLFGGCKPGNECKTLQRLINENYSTARNPIHDAFSAITIQEKSDLVDLDFWRELINGVKTKKAISLFSSAADIANKFGPILNIKHYDYCFTNIYPTIHNSKPCVLYVYRHEKQEKYGYAFLKNNKYVSGTIQCSDLDDIVTSLKTPTISEQKIIFDSVNLTLPENEKISRKLKIEEVDTLQGKLTYERYNEHGELALLCKKYKVSESIFNRCLDLIPKNKEKDYLPTLTLYGHSVDKSCSDYILTKLPHNDPRAFLLGIITKCCQFIGGDSEKCVINGWEKENNGFYVLLKTKNNGAKEPVHTITGEINYAAYEIIGQAYAWNSTFGNLVFDSWENAWPAHDDIVVKMVTAFSEQIIATQQYNIYRITIGCGGKTPSALKKNKISSDFEIMLEGHQYSDSILQSLVASVEDMPTIIKPLRKKIEILIDNIDKLSITEKEKLKNLTSNPFHYLSLLEHTRNDKSNMSDIINKIIHYDCAFTHIFPTMITLQIQHREKIEEIMLYFLQNTQTYIKKQQEYFFNVSFLGKFLNKLDEFCVFSIDSRKEAARQFFIIKNILDNIYNGFSMLSNCISLILYNVTDKNKKALEILQKNLNYFSDTIISEILQTNDKKLCDQETLSILLSNHNIYVLNTLLSCEKLTELQRNQIWFLVENNLSEFTANNAEVLIYLLRCKQLTEIQFKKIIQEINITTYTCKIADNLVLLMKHNKLTVQQHNQIWRNSLKNLSNIIGDSYENFILLIACQALSKTQCDEVMTSTNFDKIIQNNIYKLSHLLDSQELSEEQKDKIIEMSYCKEFILSSAKNFVKIMECKTLTHLLRNKIFMYAENKLLNFISDDSSAFELLSCKTLTDAQRNIICVFFIERLSIFFTTGKIYHLTFLLECKILSEFQRNQVWDYAKNNLLLLLSNFGYNLVKLLKCNVLTDEQRQHIWATVKGSLSIFFSSGINDLIRLLNSVQLTENEFNQILMEINLSELFIKTWHPLTILKCKKLSETQRNKIIQITDIKTWQTYSSYDLVEILKLEQLTEENRSQLLNFIQQLDFEEKSLFKMNLLYDVISLLECKALSEKNRHQIFCAIQPNFDKLIKGSSELIQLLESKGISQENKLNIWNFFERNCSEIVKNDSFSSIVALLKCEKLNEDQRDFIFSLINIKEKIFHPVDAIKMLNEDLLNHNDYMKKYFLSELNENKQLLNELLDFEQLTRSHIDLILNAIQDERLSVLIPDEDERNSLLEKHAIQEVVIQNSMF